MTLKIIKPYTIGFAIGIGIMLGINQLNKPNVSINHGDYNITFSSKTNVVKPHQLPRLSRILNLYGTSMNTYLLVPGLAEEFEAVDVVSTRMKADICMEQLNEFEAPSQEPLYYLEKYLDKEKSYQISVDSYKTVDEIFEI